MKWERLKATPKEKSGRRNEWIHSKWIETKCNDWFSAAKISMLCDRALLCLFAERKLFERRNSRHRSEKIRQKKAISIEERKDIKCSKKCNERKKIQKKEIVSEKKNTEWLHWFDSMIGLFRSKATSTLNFLFTPLSTYSGTAAFVSIMNSPFRISFSSSFCQYHSKFHCNYAACADFVELECNVCVFMASREIEVKTSMKTANDKSQQFAFLLRFSSIADAQKGQDKTKQRRSTETRRQKKKTPNGKRTNKTILIWFIYSCNAKRADQPIWFLSASASSTINDWIANRFRFYAVLMKNFKNHWNSLDERYFCIALRCVRRL